MKHDVMAVADIAVGQVAEVNVGGTSIALVRLSETEFRALRDRCPHQGARLSAGRVTPFVTGEHTGVYEIDTARLVLRCPWHGYEFELETGHCPVDAATTRVKTYAVMVEGGRVLVER